MHKPDIQLDALEEVENILSRLAPPTMSEKAMRSTVAMIDDLVKNEQEVSKRNSKSRYWWQSGIAATLMAGAGFAFLKQDAYESKSLVARNQTESMKKISDEIWIEQENGARLSAVSYQEERSNELVDEKNGFIIQAGLREEGALFEDASKF